MAIIEFRNTRRGENEVRSVDTEELRVRHLRARLHAWCIAMWQLKNQGVNINFFRVMLTYRNQAELRLGERQSPWHKLDISRYIFEVTQFYKDKLLGYTWVCEKHESGAIHYHVCLAMDASVTKMLHADRNGWWRHGWSGTGTIKAPSYTYLAKYLQKSASKLGGKGAYHKGMRIFAAVVKKKAWAVLPVLQRFWFKLSAAVAFVRGKILDTIKVHRYEDWYLTGWSWKAMPGGGWYVAWNNGYKTIWWLWQSDWRYQKPSYLDYEDRAHGAYSYE